MIIYVIMYVCVTAFIFYSVTLNEKMKKIFVAITMIPNTYFVLNKYMLNLINH